MSWCIAVKEQKQNAVSCICSDSFVQRGGTLGQPLEDGIMGESDCSLHALDLREGFRHAFSMQF